MILSMAHASVAEADRQNLYGEWSDLVVGAKPDGLVSAYLLADGEHVRVAALWISLEAHDRARDEENTHPAFKVFEAAGLDPLHSVMHVMGALS